MEAKDAIDINLIKTNLSFNQNQKLFIFFQKL